MFCSFQHFYVYAAFIETTDNFLVTKNGEEELFRTESVTTILVTVVKDFENLVNREGTIFTFVEELK